MIQPSLSVRWKQVTWKLKTCRRVAEIYAGAVQELTRDHYTPEQIAVWVGTRPDAAGWRELLAGLTTLMAEIDALEARPFFAAEGYTGLDHGSVHPWIARLRQGFGG